jgi:hypothetical protein
MQHIAAASTAEADLLRGLTPLQLAAMCSAPSAPLAVTELLNAGASVRRTDVWGRTALQLAAEAGQEGTFAVLLQVCAVPWGGTADCNHAEGSMAIATCQAWCAELNKKASFAGASSQVCLTRACCKQTGGVGYVLGAVS